MIITTIVGTYALDTLSIDKYVSFQFQTVWWRLVGDADSSGLRAISLPDLNLSSIIYWLCHLVSPFTTLGLSFPSSDLPGDQAISLGLKATAGLPW